MSEARDALMEYQRAEMEMLDHFRAARAARERWRDRYKDMLKPLLGVNAAEQALVLEAARFGLVTARSELEDALQMIDELDESVAKLQGRAVQ